MAEKKEGFGLNPAHNGAGGPPVVYETPDYRVIPGKLSSGPEGTAPELLVRYVIQHKRHGVIYGTAGGLGQAIAAAVQAQIELANATAAAAEYEARNFNVKDDKEGGPVIPNFGNMN